MSASASAGVSATVFCTQIASILLLQRRDKCGAFLILYEYIRLSILERLQEFDHVGDVIGMKIETDSRVLSARQGIPDTAPHAVRVLDFVGPQVALNVYA